MGNYELNDDDVLYLETKAPFFGEPTALKVSEMKGNLQKKFCDLTNFNNANIWLNEGFTCNLLSATEGRGWKRGKIRLRLEIILDEPEPEAEPEPTKDDPNSLDSLRTELYPKQ